MLLHKIIEFALNKIFSLDAESKRRLTELQGKIIALDAQVPFMEYYLFFTDTTIKVRRHSQLFDAKISGKPTAFLKFSLANSEKTKFSKTGLQISGDADVLQTFNDILDSLDIDWEEYLSRWTGDVVAHGLAELIRAARDWGKSSTSVITDNITEFLQEETRMFPTQREVDDFYTDNQDLSCDVDRLQARLQRMQKTK